MDIHSLFNYTISSGVSDGNPGGLQPAGQQRGRAQTFSTFVTPQMLAAYPFAAGLVAGFWQAAQAILGSVARASWVCFAIALAIAFLNYWISSSDPKLSLSARDKKIGFAFTLVNAVYLFMAAIGIKAVLPR